MPLLTHKMFLEDIKCIFARSANRNFFFVQTAICFLKSFARDKHGKTGKRSLNVFKPVIHFQPGHRWQKTRINTLSELVWCLTKKRSIIFIFSFI